MKNKQDETENEDQDLEKEQVKKVSKDDPESLVGKDKEDVEKFAEKHKIENFRVVKATEFYELNVDPERITFVLGDEDKVKKVIYG